MRAEIDQSEMLAYIDGHTAAIGYLQKEAEKSYGVGDTIVCLARVPMKDHPEIKILQKRVGKILATDMSLLRPRAHNFAVEIAYDGKPSEIVMVPHHFIDAGETKLAQEHLGKDAKNICPVLVVIED